MPDLGKYADTVLSSYAVSIALLAGLVVMSIWQSKRAKARLAEVEARRKSDAARQ
ncbi:heme exporter protein D [Litoreibacter ponti]|uniref:Heme exporter protein D n=1 Tax=Litoreibacter ponti TaxID=1510457 RepID=A0A2T6BH86_9RHOB|nr:heme exporter protein CcmD [Litoreibacter ponti]PTX55421.1 heme exporter protein D [Litoreibacter ponti]